MAHIEAPIGKTKVYGETFKSPFGKDTESQAEKVLDIIRECHPASSGWVEEAAGIEKRDGKYYAWRKHAQYR